MRLLVSTILAVALLCLAPTASWADLAPYSQDFELLGTGAEDPAALANDGWLVWANVFGPDWSYWYGYPSPTPNGGPGYCGVDTGQGGPPQGEKQLVVYNDYNNGNHGDGSNAIIEANVFQEQMIGAADVGNTWRFEFDAKRGNIEGDSMAAAFFKTLDPGAGWALTNYIPVPMTDIPDTWDSYSVDIDIDPSLEGQILQFGFINWASNYEGSGIFYDNIGFDLAPLSVSLDIRPGGCPNPITGRVQGLIPAALLGTGDLDVNDIDVASLQLEGVAPVRSAYEDVAEPFAGDLCGCTEAGPDGLLDLTLKFSARDLIGAIASSQSGERELTLTGTLLDGTPIEGQDCIVTVGRAGRAAVLEALSRTNPLMPVNSTRKANGQPMSRPSRSE
jgi:hypothetical protein